MQRAKGRAETSVLTPHAGGFGRTLASHLSTASARLACTYGTTYPSSGGIFSVSSFLIFTRLRACTHVSVTRPQCLLMVLVHPLVGSAESITTHFSWDQPRLVEPCARSYPLGLQSSPRRRCGSSTMAVRPLSGPSTCMAETASHRQTPCSALLETLNPHTLSACASRTRRRCTATSRTYRRHSWRTRRSCEGRLCRRYVHD